MVCRTHCNSVQDIIHRQILIGYTHTVNSIDTNAIVKAYSVPKTLKWIAAVRPADLSAYDPCYCGILSSALILLYLVLLHIAIYVMIYT